MYGADLTKTLVYGLIVAIPAIIIGGPVFASTLKKYNPQPLKSLIVQKEFGEDEMPGIWISVLSALSPVLLLLLGGLPEVVSMPGRFLPVLFSIFKEPAIAMLIAILLVTFTLGVRRGRSFSELTSIYHEAVKSVAVVLLIIAGAGAFKEVLVSAGINEEIGLILADLDISPIILAWGIAGVIRICVGSATVAGLTAAGIMLPVIATSGINPSLMVLATGAGSLLFSHVNDGGFWLFKEFFNMSLVDTFKTWTVMETIVSVTGLLGVLALSVFV
jgi:Gnt-I system high-affinity gluconate transporter